MRLLDLFCGAGGAARGYARAGFTEILGVDSAPQPNYPYAFVQADALDYLARLIAGDGSMPDAIHASPPCQAFSALRHTGGRAYPDLLTPTRELLRQSAVPYVIENVPGAPLNFSVRLCGSMFGLGAMSGNGTTIPRAWRELRRHRLFETSFPLLQPPCQHNGEAIGVYGGGPAARASTARGGYQATAAEARAAMDLPGLTGPELAQAIPPAYTELIGTTLAALLSPATVQV